MTQPAPIKHPYNPWYKATYTFDQGGVRLQLRVPSDVFSTQRIDEGTLLLLENLAEGAPPSTILDVGCGYGALGLPVAARYPGARLELIDRDLLAAHWSADNARANGLTNVDAHGSLGFRDVKGATFDWILCNVPARIGRPFIWQLVEEGRARLNPGGDLRLVVINDLMTTLQELAFEGGWPLHEVKRGPRHTIVAFGPSGLPPRSADDRTLYTRDHIEIAGLRLSRPFDLGGDDPKRLTQGLPVLLDSLPRDPSRKIARILAFRIGYGILPIVSRQRWPDATVVGVDRDLLGTSFARLNAADLGVAGERLEIRESAHFPDALAPGEKFDLILGEFSPSAGEGVLQAEVRAIAAALAPGGQAYLLCLDKVEKDWVRPFATKQRLSLIATIKRAGYTVLRLA